MYLLLNVDRFDEFTWGYPRIAVIDLRAHRERLDRCLDRIKEFGSMLKPAPKTIRLSDCSPRWIQDTGELDDCDFYEELCQCGNPVLVEELPDFLREDHPDIDRIESDTGRTRLIVERGQSLAVRWESTLTDTGVPIATDTMTWDRLHRLTVYPGLMIEDEPQSGMGR